MILEFVRGAFRKWYSAILYITIVFCIIIGFVGGIYFGILSSNPIIGVFGAILLGALGLLIGLFGIIIGGGLVATFLNIDKNLEKQTSLLTKLLGGKSLQTDNTSISDSDDWVCKKCSKNNRNTALFCNSCGEKK